MHKYELILPRGERAVYVLWVKDSIELVNLGESESVIKIERRGRRRTRITIRADEERITAEDHKLLEETAVDIGKVLSASATPIAEDDRG